MVRITTIINQKGGVGKTTTAHALATGLNHRGYKALVVDTDPQANLSDTMRAEAGAPGLYEVMRDESNAKAAIQHTAQGDLLASSLDLAGADMEFTQTGREFILRDLLQPMLDEYTHVIIDSPPSLGILTVNALTAATDMIIPLGADIYSLQGLKHIFVIVERVKRFCNPGLSIAGLLITRKSGRATLTAQLLEAIRIKANELDTHLYEAVIREGIAVKESQIIQSSLFDTHAHANVAADYNKLIDEYLAQERVV